jgi:hypothetical protein
MFGISRHAAHGIFAVGLTGLITLTTAPAFASTAPAGHAATHSATHSASRPAGQSKDPTARYHSWRRAQRAAGFRLKVPARTYGLTRKNAILVGPCDAAGQRRKRDVYAEWGAGQAFLAVDQNNSGGACSNFGAARFLGRFRVQGHRARMYGFCGSHGLPSCRSKAAVLVLTWRAGKRFYVVYSSHQWRATLLGFARHLRFL